MQVLYERCCGLDVHSRTVVACLRTPGPDGTRQSRVRTFGTTTGALLELAQWLTEAGCTHAAVESTGVYWQPVYNVLEGTVEVILVNAEQVKAVPGRKTDVKDCEWIAQLLEHGLLRASFIPPRPIRELRELTRYRKRLIQERAREAARLHKVLESANIKLGTVATDILGASGRQMIKALIAGERDAQVLAELAKGALRLKRAALGAALTGRFTEHHAFLAQQVLAHVEYLDGAIAHCDARIVGHTRPFAGRIDQLCTIPGVARRSAEALLAEVGDDMASWACVCPGNDDLLAMLRREILPEVRRLVGERRVTLVFDREGCQRDGSPLTQKIVQDHVRRSARRAQLAKGGVHRLRHSFCSHLAMRGAPARAIQELAGHQDLVTTQRYMHLSPAAIEGAIRLLDQAKPGLGLGDILETADRKFGNSLP